MRHNNIKYYIARSEEYIINRQRHTMYKQNINRLLYDGPSGLYHFQTDWWARGIIQTIYWNRSYNRRVGE